MINSLFRYVLSLTFDKITVKLLLCLVKSEGRKRVFERINIISPTAEDFDAFSFSIYEALRILKSEFSVEYRIVARNIQNILYNPRDVEYMAMYLQKCCYIPWENWRKYETPIRNKLLAAAIVHEAYHGECHKQFGMLAYCKNSHYEQKCRDREIRVLTQFMRNSGEDDFVIYNERIATLTSLKESVP